ILLSNSLRSSTLIPFSSTIPSPSDIYTLSLHDALPIYFLRHHQVSQAESREQDRAKASRKDHHARTIQSLHGRDRTAGIAVLTRSEERRVGKGCARWLARCW